MKNTHETQSTEEYVYEEGKIYSPIEDLQRIESGGAYNKDSLDISKQPKGIRYIGYFIIGFIVITFLLITAIYIFFN
ncbi:hypothetical protein [Bacillus sp. CECT 9360]|uniref:hypothetical protein n=1 Tax=Bacillus sp. CECT 9360 TaxID=2845821 RepID=UPI001E2FD1B1|nr:hypothetical protein [Bacillus sp. CECT 9360]CAH0344988.1 hypothetical protein BCI9360_01263 [Bacillus sp. CECT 9360]